MPSCHGSILAPAHHDHAPPERGRPGTARPAARRFRLAAWCVAAPFPILASPAHAMGLQGHSLTVTGMFLQADWVVKLVMIVLILASVAVLSICIYKAREIAGSRRDMAQSVTAIEAAPSLAAIGALPDETAADMVKATRSELDRRPAGNHAWIAEGVKERSAALIQRIEAGRLRQLSRGLSILGSIGAAAPFIGLFGTVWGIMNSFIGIAETNTTNLAVVAPGIAEALLATAFGLVAAIPAVLAYNAVTRAVAGYRVRMNDAATQIMCLLSRDMDAGDMRTTADAEARHGVQA